MPYLDLHLHIQSIPQEFYKFAFPDQFYKINIPEMTSFCHKDALATLFSMAVWQVALPTPSDSLLNILRNIYDTTILCWCRNSSSRHPQAFQVTVCILSCVLNIMHIRRLATLSKQQHKRARKLLIPYPQNIQQILLRHPNVPLQPPHLNTLIVFLVFQCQAMLGPKVTNRRQII